MPWWNSKLKKVRGKTRSYSTELRSPKSRGERELTYTEKPLMIIENKFCDEVSFKQQGFTDILQKPTLTN